MKTIKIILIFVLFSSNIFCQTKISPEEKNRIFLEEVQNNEKKASEKRRIELEIACEKGVEYIVAFANKYPNTPEAVQAIRVLRKFNAENNVISNKISVNENYIWVAEGDRGWLNEVLEKSRNSVSGGKQYNVFGFATLQNRTDSKIKLKAVVNLNLTKISNLSILYSSENYSLSENYYTELLPRQSKSILVLFKNLSEGFSIGKSLNDRTIGGSLFSIGSQSNINENRPISVELYEVDNLPTKTVEIQNRLISEVKKNSGNIKVNNLSQNDIINKFLDKYIGTNSENQTTLRIYFSKKSSTEEELKIYDSNGTLKVQDKYDSAGDKNISYTLKAYSKYSVYVPGCTNPYSVSLKKGITHLIVNKDCQFKINNEDEKE